MKIVITHTDFRIYWPARLHALTVYLSNKSIELQIIEIAGAGSPYAFSGSSASHPANWHCLFPDKRMEDISPSEANITLGKKLNELQPDVVFAGAIAFPSGAAGVRWAVEHKKRVVIFDNARLADVPRSWLVDFIKKKIYSCTDAVLCPSKAWMSTFTYFGFKESQIFYGLNVVDNSFWQNQDSTESHKSTSGYILTIGRQIPKKNFLSLLNAYQGYIANTVNPRELILVGDGPEHELLVDFVKKNRLNTVKFLPFKSQDELKNIYQRADCFVLPSKHGETWGLVVNEAMVSGLPVLVSNQIGCASTLVKDGMNGYTFSPDNVNELTELLLKMDGLSVRERLEMGEKSKEIISDWGLDRFCLGVYDAIQFVSGSAAKKSGVVTRLILKLWRGRYRPV
ncbi:MAG: glycosyltransferase family 4 protein [Bacteroidales bacterium]|nr:glycosyltransferase family 4 protein [Bacteroidales bacterium]